MTPKFPQAEALANPQFLRDVLAGLSRFPKTLPCKYFYDEIGSQLFDQICELDEYYPTRTELRIMEESADEMTAEFGSACVLVEYGSGSSWKSRLLLDRLDERSTYIPVDISREHLQQTALGLEDQYPHLNIQPVCADFTKPFELPPLPSRAGRKVAYFPGSTIGNFSPDRAVELLRQIRELVKPDGGLLIGVDLPKSPKILEAAYDDSQGVTAQFNLNLLERINRELDAEIPVELFEHEARFNQAKSRVEMHLVASEALTVNIDDVEIEFAEGESIHTENSHKFSLPVFENLAQQAGFQVDRVWTDPDNFFSVQFLSLPARTAK